MKSCNFLGAIFLLLFSVNCVGDIGGFFGSVRGKYSNPQKEAKNQSEKEPLREKLIKWLADPGIGDILDATRKMKNLVVGGFNTAAESAALATSAVGVGVTIGGVYAVYRGEQFLQENEKKVTDFLAQMKSYFNKPDVLSKLFRELEEIDSKIAGLEKDGAWKHPIDLHKFKRAKNELIESIKTYMLGEDVIVKCDGMQRKYSSLSSSTHDPCCNKTLAFLRGLFTVPKSAGSEIFRYLYWLEFVLRLCWNDYTMSEDVENESILKDLVKFKQYFVYQAFAQIDIDELTFDQDLFPGKSEIFSSYEKVFRKGNSHLSESDLASLRDTLTEIPIKPQYLTVINRYAGDVHNDLAYLLIGNKNTELSAVLKAGVCGLKSLQSILTKSDLVYQDYNLYSFPREAKNVFSIKTKVSESLEPIFLPQIIGGLELLAKRILYSNTQRQQQWILFYYQTNSELDSLRKKLKNSGEGNTFKELYPRVVPVKVSAEICKKINDMFEGAIESKEWPKKNQPALNFLYNDILNYTLFCLYQTSLRESLATVDYDGYVVNKRFVDDEFVTMCATALVHELLQDVNKLGGKANNKIQFVKDRASEVSEDIKEALLQDIAPATQKQSSKPNIAQPLDFADFVGFAPKKSDQSLDQAVLSSHNVRAGKSDNDDDSFGDGVFPKEVFNFDEYKNYYSFEGPLAENSSFIKDLQRFYNYISANLDGLKKQKRIAIRDLQLYLASEDNDRDDKPTVTIRFKVNVNPESESEVMLDYVLSLNTDDLSTNQFYWQYQFQKWFKTSSGGYKVDVDSINVTMYPRGVDWDSFRKNKADDVRKFQAFLNDKRVSYKAYDVLAGLNEKGSSHVEVVAEDNRIFSSVTSGVYPKDFGCLELDMLLSCLENKEFKHECASCLLQGLVDTGEPLFKTISLPIIDFGWTSILDRQLQGYSGQVVLQNLKGWLPLNSDLESVCNFAKFLQNNPKIVVVKSGFSEVLKYLIETYAGLSHINLIEKNDEDEVLNYLKSQSGVSALWQPDYPSHNYPNIPGFMKECSFYLPIIIDSNSQPDALWKALERAGLTHSQLEKTPKTDVSRGESLSSILSANDLNKLNGIVAKVMHKIRLLDADSDLQLKLNFYYDFGNVDAGGDYDSIKFDFPVTGFKLFSRETISQPFLQQVGVIKGSKSVEIIRRRFGLSDASKRMIFYQSYKELCDALTNSEIDQFVLDDVADGIKQLVEFTKDLSFKDQLGILSFNNMSFNTKDLVVPMQIDVGGLSERVLVTDLDKIRSEMGVDQPKLADSDRNISQDIIWKDPLLMGLLPKLDLDNPNSDRFILDKIILKLMHFIKSKEPKSVITLKLDLFNKNKELESDQSFVKFGFQIPLTKYYSTIARSGQKPISYDEAFESKCGVLRDSVGLKLKPMLSDAAKENIVTCNKYSDLLSLDRFILDDVSAGINEMLKDNNNLAVENGNLKLKKTFGKDRIFYPHSIFMPMVISITGVQSLSTLNGLQKEFESFNPERINNVEVKLQEDTREDVGDPMIVESLQKDPDKVDVEAVKEWSDEMVSAHMSSDLSDFVACFVNKNTKKNLFLDKITAVISKLYAGLPPIDRNFKVDLDLRYSEQEEPSNQIQIFIPDLFIARARDLDFLSFDLFEIVRSLKNSDIKLGLTNALLTRFVTDKLDIFPELLVRCTTPLSVLLGVGTDFQVALVDDAFFKYGFVKKAVSVNLIISSQAPLSEDLLDQVRKIGK